MAIALIFLVFLVVFHQFFPQFAVYFHSQGEQQYKEGQLEQALSNYQKAIALNPSYAQAHYHLGILYEDLQQFDQANAEYQLAVKQDNSANSLTRLQADNNWGHLLILQKEYAKAITPLLEGKNTLDEERVKNNQDFQKVKYALLKNLGCCPPPLKRGRTALLSLKERPKSN